MSLKPKAPKKPVAPKQPVEPPKHFNRDVIVGHLDDIKYKTYTLDELKQAIKVSLDKPYQHIDPFKVSMSFDCDYSRGYYDDVMTEIDVVLSLNEEVDNPNYAQQYEQYLVAMKDYEAKLPAHKKALKTYNAAMKTYKAELAKSELQQALDRVKALEKKLKGKTK